MIEIIERYINSCSPYVFPILKNYKESFAQWKQIRNALATYNRKLKSLATLTDIGEKLTGYVARHSWATIASQEGVPVSVISRGMGHESEKTTSIYISRVDYSDVGEANKLILSRFAKEIPMALTS